MVALRSPYINRVGKAIKFTKQFPKTHFPECVLQIALFRCAFQMRSFKMRSFKMRFFPSFQDALSKCLVQTTAEELAYAYYLYIGFRTLMEVGQFTKNVTTGFDKWSEQYKIALHKIALCRV